jgi:hypothetical protein
VNGNVMHSADCHHHLFPLSFIPRRGREAIIIIPLPPPPIPSFPNFLFFPAWSQRPRPSWGFIFLRE